MAALIVALVLAFSTLGLARANTVGLYGGLECYGTGTTGAADGAVNADTFINGAPCNGATQVYLAATTPVGYANHAGTWGVVGIYWGTAAPSANGTHNLCHFVCNGYANTSAP